MPSPTDRDDEPLQIVAKLDEALVPIQRDLDRTFGRFVRVEATVDDVLARPIVLVDGAGCSSEVRLDARREATIAEVADDVQAELMDQDATRFWPTCADHLRGLHPQVREGLAVWWCRGGDHVVAPIGQLEPGSLETTSKPPVRPR